MKIAFYITTILEYSGGFEKFFIDTAKELSKFSNVTIDIITRDDDFTIRLNKYLHGRRLDKNGLFKESFESIKKTLGTSRYRKTQSWKELRNTLQEYDVVYSKNEFLEATIFRLIIGYKNIPPVIFCCGTPLHFPNPQTFSQKLRNYMYQSWIYSFLTSGVRKFHVKNALDQKILKERYPQKEVLKIYSPIDEEAFHIQVDENKFDFAWDKTRTNILWVGRLSEQKGVRDFLDIVETFNTSDYRDKITWNIAGDGELRDDILALQKRWKNVNYFGHVLYDYLPNIYANSDLYLSTSKWESFGQTIQEAQTAGTPILCYDIPGPREIITYGETGITAETKEMMIALLKKILDGQIFFEKHSNKKEFRKENIYPQILSSLATFQR